MDASVTGNVSGQMNFGGDGSIVTVTTKQFTGINIVDISVDNVVYHVYAPQPDSIVISDLITEGTKIGRISINGVNYDIYSPTDGSGSDVNVIPLLDHGTEIASITVDGETAHIFAPTPQTVSATAQYDTGVLVGNINIGGNITYFYIPDYGADITTLDNRLDLAEDDITALDLRLDTAEDNITGLTTRMGTAEGNITGLTTRMGTAEGNITGLTNRMGAAEGNITNLSGRMTEAENDITALGIECDAIAADLAAPYDEEETYSVGDYCTHDKVLYKCNTAISTPEEWDVSHWDAVKVCDDITEINSALSDLDFEDITSSLTFSGYYIASHANFKCFKSKSIMYINVALQLQNNPPASTPIITGFPTNIAINPSLGAMSGGKVVRINSSGQLTNDDALSSGWLTGSFVVLLTN